MCSKEEDEIVAFMKTLSDGFTTPYANSDTFSGACLSGGSAATQGNESLIPTPPLPPCAPAICGAAPLPGPKAISQANGAPSNQERPRISNARAVRLLQGPEIELATEYLTVIRWKTINPGGSPVHYGIVHYGTDPDRLVETAESPIRLNPDGATTVFRVRITNLKNRKSTTTGLRRWRRTARAMESSALRRV